MDKLWVDQWLRVLNLCLEGAGRAKWALFEPTPIFYAKLESGDYSDLQVAATELGRHLGLGVLPSVTCEWGLKLKPETAGRIRFRGSLPGQIQIPLFYVGKPLALGAILAHELTHELLACEGVTCANADEFEQLIDLASIALGLGKLVLNGTITELALSAGESQTLGYLSLELKAYAYRQVNEQHMVPDTVAREHLSEEALHILEVFT